MCKSKINLGYLKYSGLNLKKYFIKTIFRKGHIRLTQANTY